jgi:hypothetical protein
MIPSLSRDRDEKTNSSSPFTVHRSLFHADQGAGIFQSFFNGTPVFRPASFAHAGLKTGVPSG